MIADDLLRSARLRPDSPALDDGARTWTYAALAARVSAAAERLRAAGAEGRSVALLAEPTGDGVAALHAVLAAGAVAVPLSPRATSREIGRALAVLSPDLVLAASDTWDLARAAGARTVPLAALDHPGASLPISSRGPSGRAPAPGARAILWTSGTGGRPRGVVLTDASLAASIAGAEQRLSLGPDDRWLASLGLAHVGGFVLVLRAAALGALVVARGRFRAEEATALVDSGAVTHASLVPTMLRQWLDLRGDRPAPSLRCVLVGGAHCPRALVERALAAGVPLALTYGMTESTSQAATAPPALTRAKPGTVGPPIAGVEIRVDEGGEILVRGATVAAGYVADEIPLAPGGWLRTGDLGEIDADGHLWITGRRSDRIVTGGVNVDPVEVEDVLRSHGGVADAAVVGLADERWGEVVGAAVVRSAGAYPDAGELEGLARARLATAKVPRRWIFLPELPRNPNGKLDRDAVRQAFPVG